MRKLQKTFSKNVLMHLGDKPKLWLAKESGINSGSLSTAISEEGNTTIRVIESISEALNVHPAVLLGGSDESTYSIPKDILELLEDQSPLVYDTIRTMLKTLNTEKKKAKRKV